MADQVVQISAGTGTKVDTSELTVGTNVVERQRVNIADPTSATGLANVSPQGGLVVTLADNLIDVLTQILEQQQLTNLLLANAFRQKIKIQR